MTKDQPLDEPSDLLTSEEVIQRLLSDTLLRRFALSCVLPAVRHGSEWRFRRQDLDAWIDRIGATRPAVEPELAPPAE